MDATLSDALVDHLCDTVPELTLGGLLSLRGMLFDVSTGGVDWEKLHGGQPDAVDAASRAALELARLLSDGSCGLDSVPGDEAHFEALGVPELAHGPRSAGSSRRCRCVPLPVVEDASRLTDADTEAILDQLTSRPD